MKSHARYRPALSVLTAVSIAVLSSIASAESGKKTDDDKPADPDTGQSTIEETTLGLLKNPFQSSGVKFAATYIGESLGNISGGVKQGAVYDGRLNLALDVDLQKLVGLPQLAFHANMFQIHGGGLSRDNMQNFFVVSGIEALPSTRLYEAWFERKWGENKVSLKLGQIAADSEFFNTKYTDVFTNASMGWPAITSVDLPSGGPSPPLAALGARLLVNVTEHFSALGAVFDGNQAGPGLDDPQMRNRYGINFRINDPPLLLGQVQYSWNNKKGDPNLEGAVKLGGWQHFDSFADERFADNAVSLLHPGSSGNFLQHQGNHGIWAIYEQEIYKIPGSDDRGIGVFTRVSSSPSDRNLIDLYADAGVGMTGLIDIRPNDKFGIAFGYAHVSRQAKALDQDYRTYVDAAAPRRTYEGLATASYQYEVRTGWTVQPNFQYLRHPGGGTTNPTGPNPGKPLKDAAIFGLRTVLKF